MPLDDTMAIIQAYDDKLVEVRRLIDDYLETHDTGHLDVNDAIGELLAIDPRDATRAVVDLFSNALDEQSSLNDFMSHWDGYRIHPAFMAVMLMQVLPGSGNGDPMTDGDKHYWFEVGKMLGPDWWNEVKHVGEFITRVMEFK